METAPIQNRYESNNGNSYDGHDFYLNKLKKQSRYLKALMEIREIYHYGKKSLL